MPSVTSDPMTDPSVPVSDSPAAPSQPPRADSGRATRRAATVVTILAVAVLTALLIQSLLLSSDDPGHDRMTFRTSIADFEGAVLGWHSLDGALALDMSMAATRLKGDDQKVTAQFLRDLCGAVLTKLPDRNGQAVARDRIYRLGFQIYTSNGTFGPVFPIAVVDGVCMPDGWPVGHWAYPQALPQVYVRSVALPKPDEAGALPEVGFAARPGITMAKEAFDPLAACRAVLADPPPGVEARLRRSGSLRISFWNVAGGSIFAFARAWKWDFTVSNGACFLSGAGDKT